MNSDLVSVVVACRNAESTIAESVRSILAQSHRDVELVVIDDGSTDRTAQIVDGMADPRIVLARMKKQSGQASALARGVEIAEGKWISRLDADDISKPQRLAIQLEVAKKMPDRIIGCSARNFGDKQGVRVRRVFDFQLQTQLLFHSPMVHSGLFGPAEIFRRFTYDPSFARSQDYDLLERATKAGVKLFNIPIPLIRYRVHSEMASKSSDLANAYQQQVHRRVLAELGLEPSSGEAALHLLLSNPRMARDFDFDTFATAKEWAQTLLRHNRKHRSYHHRDLRFNLGNRLRILAPQTYHSKAEALPVKKSSRSVDSGAV